MSDDRVSYYWRCLEGDLERHEAQGWSEYHREHIPSVSEAVVMIERKPASDTVKKAVAWLAEIQELLIVKNAKYGDSAANPMRVFSRASPVEQLLVRIDDKLSRIARADGLLDTDEDVLRDLVGYLALLAALKKQE